MPGSSQGTRTTGTVSVVETASQPFTAAPPDFHRARNRLSLISLTPCAWLIVTLSASQPRDSAAVRE